MPSDPLGPYHIIVFDGQCHLCTWAVRFVVKRDPRVRFKFASMQSNIGRHCLQEAGLNPDTCDSIVVLAQDRVWTESDAVLQIARHLRGLWPTLAVFRCVPRKLRNGLYRWIARNRYRWFGKRITCLVPTPTLRARFLSDDLLQK